MWTLNVLFRHKFRRVGESRHHRHHRHHRECAHVDDPHSTSDSNLCHKQTFNVLFRHKFDSKAGSGDVGVVGLTVTSADARHLREPVSEVDIKRPHLTHVRVGAGQDLHVRRPCRATSALLTSAPVSGRRLKLVSTSGEVKRSRTTPFERANS